MVALIRHVLPSHFFAPLFHDQVMDAYGDALEAERKHEDAGVAYLAAGQLAKAMGSYR